MAGQIKTHMLNYYHEMSELAYDIMFLKLLKLSELNVIPVVRSPVWLEAVASLLER